MEAKNPYAPPKAAVDDISSGQEPPRPAQVTRAVQLLWIALAIGLGSGILSTYMTETPGVSKSALIGATLFMYAIAVLIAWWIISSIGKGKNWARIVQLVFFILGVLSAFMLFAMPQVPAIIWVLYALQMGINLWGLILLFSGAGSNWFREMKEWL